MRKVVVTTLIFCLLWTLTIWGQVDVESKLPKEKAGIINQPTGKIAFTRDKNLWVMDWNGMNQFKVVTAENAMGKLSWAPDGKRVAFCRSGKVDLQGPDHLGGQHKVYDIFVGYLDSARGDTPTTNWWRRLTDDLGARFPEWIGDNKIAFTKDLNANAVNALKPNYQVCFMDSIGGSFDILRTDWKNSENHMLMPTFGPNDMMAFVFIENVNPMGIVIASTKLKTLTAEDIKTKAKIIPGAVAPAWSPDGKWIAYINNSVDKQGIFITAPDLSERYIVFKPGIGQILQTFPVSWAPDSKWLTFALGDGSIWIIDVTGNGLRQILGPGTNEAPAWSKK